MLSEASKLKRRREKMVNLQMTGLSWCLEFFAGISTVIRILVGNGPWPIKFVAILFDVCFNFILIPTSYLLNTEVYKSPIIANGWWQSFRKKFCLRCTRRVEPEQVVDTKASDQRKVMPQPIPSIAGNIEALSEKNTHNMCEHVLKKFSEHHVPQNNPLLNDENDVLEELTIAQLLNNPNLLEEGRQFIQQEVQSSLRTPPNRFTPPPILQRTDDPPMPNDNGNDIEMITISDETSVSRQYSTNVQQMLKRIKKNNYVSFRK